MSLKYMESVEGFLNRSKSFEDYLKSDRKFEDFIHSLNTEILFHFGRFTSKDYRRKNRAIDIPLLLEEKRKLQPFEKRKLVREYVMEVTH